MMLDLVIAPLTTHSFQGGEGFGYGGALRGGRRPLRTSEQARHGAGSDAAVQAAAVQGYVWGMVDISAGVLRMMRTGFLSQRGRGRP